MAEIVEYRVDRTLEELNLLVEFGLFTDAQAKKVVQKRQDFEYRLRRRKRTELDYLEYIKYEINMLESIDGYRKTVIKNYYKQKRTESDKDLDQRILLLQAKKLNDVVRSRSAHISSLFRKLTSSFQFNKMLWQAYIDFAISRKWNTRVTALYWRLLRVASNDQNIWIAAASHEIEVNKAYDSARSLYLRALRHHPNSSAIWFEYFKMEMKFMQVVKQRARVVFKDLDKKDETPLDDMWVGDDEDDEELRRGGEEDIDESIATEEDKNKGKDTIRLENPINQDDLITSGHLPKKVYDEAIKLLLGTQGYRRFVVDVINYLSTQCQQSLGLESVKSHVLDSIKSSNEKSTCNEKEQDWSYCLAIRDQYEQMLGASPDNTTLAKKRKRSISNSAILRECFRKEGITRARHKFKELDKSVINQRLSLYVVMIRIECKELERDKSQYQINRIRTLFDKAVLKFGKTEQKLWLKYLKFEHSLAKSLEDLIKINELYGRAQKTLEPSKVQQLIEKYTLCILHKESATQLEDSDYSDLSDD